MITRVLLLTLTTVIPVAPLGARQTPGFDQEPHPLGLRVHSRHYQSPFRFEIAEPAYVAVFRIKGNIARLVFPYRGLDLRQARFANDVPSDEPQRPFPPGEHIIPREVPGNWAARSENKTLPHGNYLLVVASRTPLEFDGLNRILRVGRSLGFVEPDLSVALARAIVSNPESDDWAAYLHWIR